MKIATKLGIGILVLIILSPLGLILPEYFKSGSAWGEWNMQKLKELVGFVPKGLAKLSGIWKAPFADYSLKPGGGRGLLHLSLEYIIAGFMGVVVTVVLVLLIGKRLTKKGN
jgi:hypothetical protein